MTTQKFKLTKRTKGRVDWDKVNATTKADIRRHKAEDDAEAAADAAAYARRKQVGIATARRMKRDPQGRFISSRKTAPSKKRLTA